MISSYLVKSKMCMSLSLWVNITTYNCQGNNAYRNKCLQHNETDSELIAAVLTRNWNIWVLFLDDPGNNFINSVFWKKMFHVYSICQTEI